MYPPRSHLRRAPLVSQGRPRPHPTPHVGVCPLPLRRASPVARRRPAVPGPEGLCGSARRGVRPVPRGEGACTYCNIQSIVKNLFKAPRGGLHGAAGAPRPAPRALSTCAWAWFLRVAIKHRCTSQPPASVCAGRAGGAAGGGGRGRRRAFRLRRVSGLKGISPFPLRRAAPSQSLPRWRTYWAPS